MVLKISIIGYGKMGREIETAARGKGIEVVSIIDPSASGNNISRKIDESSLANADAAIDFSSPAAVIENIESVAALGKNIVVGTTGWYDGIEKARAIVENNNMGLIYSQNFSVGMNFYLAAIEHCASLFNLNDDYDVYAYELHHRQKLDAPSGTAMKIEKILLDNISRKKEALHSVEGRILPEQLNVASIRAGYIPGTHVVGFDSFADTVEIKHSARNRSGFAAGALLAAQWLQNRKGFFSMQDFMRHYFENAGKS
jgi:4-hydroxy-tetrahydrodipicolinate reductase